MICDIMEGNINLRVAALMRPLALLALELKAMSDYITIELGKRKNVKKHTAIVSIADAEFVTSLSLNVEKVGNTYYVRVWFSQKERPHLHRMILSRKLERDLLPTEFVDHINGNGLDNRRENLRVATPSQNQHNSRKPKNNTSGYKGVYKRGNKWCAAIAINYKTIFLGYHDTAELAHEAYCKAAIKYHGEFANEG